MHFAIYHEHLPDFVSRHVEGACVDLVLGRLVTKCGFVYPLPGNCSMVAEQPTRTRVATLITGLTQVMGRR
jgi:hypothetical protein